MFWVQHKKSKILYKVFGWRDGAMGYLEYYVYDEQGWIWISSKFVEPTSPAMHIETILDNEYDKKFVHYYVNEE